MTIYDIIMMIVILGVAGTVAMFFVVQAIVAIATVFYQPQPRGQLMPSRQYAYDHDSDI